MTTGIETGVVHRILCPVDFSESSQEALRYAARSSGNLNAELVLAHAFDTPKELNLLHQTVPLKAELTRQLDALPTLHAHGHVKRLLDAGPAGEVICWMAQQHQCDLIVMGTHGWTGRKHLFLGSVAEYVMRHARCPVLTIRARLANERILSEPIVMPLPPPRLM